MRIGFLSFIFAISIFFLSKVSASVLSDFKNELNPEGRLRFQWKESIEKDRDVSSPTVLARGGIFPYFEKKFQLGVEVSTYQNSSSGPDSTIQFSNAMTSKSIGLSQIFLGFTSALPRFSKVNYSIKVGKFASPFFISPMLWDPLTRPEGLYQSFSWKNSSEDFSIGVFAAQLSADQIAQSSGNLRRSWILAQGIFSEFLWSSDSQLKFSTHLFHYQDPSERLATYSGSKGNTYLGTLTNDPTFRYEYSPIEIIGELRGKPLGFAARFLAAGAVNLRTPDKQRGFFLQGSLGETWKKESTVFDLSYIYAEPDLSVAAFSDSSYGHLNRKGPRAKASYFLLDNMCLSGVFLYAEILRASAQQASRKEFLAELEAKF
ncbi:MAG: putative porin [Deltaproteobacteria bacterium]|nr:putative porin [Deltaproteobacteria bacterium]